jgi:hypothetical protein
VCSKIVGERSSEVRCEPTEVSCADLKAVDRIHIVSDGEMCADLDLADRRYRDVVDESLVVTIEDFQRPLDCFRRAFPDSSPVRNQGTDPAFPPVL